MENDIPILKYPKGRLIAVGDIHGCLDELKVLVEHLEKKENFGEADKLVFIGDYIDRGPDSKGVIDYLLQLKAKYPACEFLKGNHEDMLLSFLGFAGEGGYYWLQNGGVEALDSYGIDNEQKLVNILNVMPREHIEFYRNLKHSLFFEHFALVHAGFNPLYDMSCQSDEDRFWIREDFIQSRHYFGKTVVFGHTPYNNVLLDAPFKIGLDSGLVYGNMLSCVDLTSGNIWQVGHNEKKVKDTSMEAMGVGLKEFTQARQRIEVQTPISQSAALRMDLDLSNLKKEYAADSKVKNKPEIPS